MNKDHIIFLIGRIHYKANKFLSQELKNHQIDGLSPSHGEILGSLMYRGPLSMTGIAKIMDKDKSTITALVRKLVKMGYVEQIKHHGDNRVTLIALTPKGAAFKPAFKLIAQKLRNQSYKGISDGERELLVDLLAEIDANL
jgi:DNA-binding MarR family transcriptional regulator